LKKIWLHLRPLHVHGHWYWDQLEAQLASKVKHKSAVPLPLFCSSLCTVQNSYLSASLSLFFPLLSLFLPLFLYLHSIFVLNFSSCLSCFKSILFPLCLVQFSFLMLYLFFLPLCSSYLFVFISSFCFKYTIVLHFRCLSLLSLFFCMFLCSLCFCIFSISLSVLVWFFFFFPFSLSIQVHWPSMPWLVFLPRNLFWKDRTTRFGFGCFHFRFSILLIKQNLNSNLKSTKHTELSDLFNVKFGFWVYSDLL